MYSTMPCLQLYNWYGAGMNIHDVYACRQRRCRLQASCGSRDLATSSYWLVPYHRTHDSSTL